MIPDALIKLLPCPFMLVDESLSVRQATGACERLLGVAEGALDGSGFPDRFLTSLGELPPSEHVARAIADGQEARFKILLRDAAGGGVPLEVRVIPLVGTEPRSAVVHLAAGATDERIEMLMLSIRRIRHEINNPLTGALGNINLLLRRDDLDEKTRRRLTVAEQEMKKIAEIVTRLAELAAPQ